MPLREAASPRGRPSRTIAKANIRRTCAPSVHLIDSARSSAPVWSGRVIRNIAPMPCPHANRRTEHRIRTCLPSESLRESDSGRVGISSKDLSLAGVQGAEPPGLLLPDRPRLLASPPARRDKAAIWGGGWRGAGGGGRLFVGWWLRRGVLRPRVSRRTTVGR